MPVNTCHTLTTCCVLPVTRDGATVRPFNSYITQGTFRHLRFRIVTFYFLKLRATTEDILLYLTKLRRKIVDLCESHSFKPWTSLWISWPIFLKVLPNILKNTGMCYVMPRHLPSKCSPNHHSSILIFSVSILRRWKLRKTSHQTKS